ncbi:transporter [Bifidobacterium margollesii]|uniref:Transporter n=1 Tax=Bifidobacterium margollesii TaxID=2020964 RepID=A0A2N5JB56_9BIFI|nr:mechanosensitive ion channel domain-containing protein [Bifidobacterium margollesii]PLS31440.1 transporter [Bifidobacterium margollesii]
MRQLIEQPWEWLQDNSGRIILLVVVVAAAALIDKAVSKALRVALDKSHIPSASIFVNIVRVLIWVMAAGIVLKPVFGIEPTTLATALGVSGIAVSFGLKDTIANVIGGFGLMVSKVLQPGDLVTLQGITGTVKDVTWRHTIIVDRTGVEMWVPNSVLNTTALEKLSLDAEALTTVSFTAKGEDLDPQAVSEEIISTVTEAAADLMLPDYAPLVKFVGFTPYGVDGRILVFAKPGVLFSTVQDRVTRALAGRDFIVQTVPPNEAEDAIRA